jgi:hypothetical protein
VKEFFYVETKKPANKIIGKNLGVKSKERKKKKKNIVS